MIIPFRGWSFFGWEKTKRMSTVFINNSLASEGENGKLENCAFQQTGCGDGSFIIWRATEWLTRTRGCVTLHTWKSIPLDSVGKRSRPSAGISSRCGTFEGTQCAGYWPFEGHSVRHKEIKLCLLTSAQELQHLLADEWSRRQTTPTPCKQG